MLNEYNLRPLILQVLLVVFSMPLAAQDTAVYSGRVLYQNSAVVDVEIVDIQSNQILGYTDSSGQFTIYLSSSPVVEFRKIGYYSITRTLATGSNLIYMDQEIVLLDQIVITENKGEKQIKKSTVSMEFIQPQLVSQTSPTNISSSINRINGVQIIDNQANIRSGSGWSYGAGSRVQVLLNGMPMLSGDAGQALWSFIPTEGIQGIEIMKGASSVIYGSSALNGVINIKTISAGAPFTTLNFTTGLYDLPQRTSLRYDGNIRYPLGNLSAFHLSKIGSWDLTLGVNMLHDLSYRMSDGETRGRTTIGIRKVDPKSGSVLGLNTGIQLGYSESFLLWESYDLGYTSLDSGITSNASLRLRIDPYYWWKGRNSDNKLQARYLKVSNAVDNGNPDNDQSNFSDFLFLEFQQKRTLFGTLECLGGIVVSSSITRSPLFSGKQSTSNAAIYAQAERGFLNNKLVANGGFRYESFRLNERAEAQPVFRFGLNWEILKASFFRLSVGQGYRFPSVAETFVSTTVGPVTVFPNEDLKSETGTNFEVGLKQGYAIGKVKGYLDVAYYRMKFNNMTEFLFAQWQAPTGIDDLGIGFKAINAGRTQVNGFELSTVLRGPFAKGVLEGFAGYTNSRGLALDPDSSMAVNFMGQALTYRNTSTSEEGNLLKYRPLHSFKMDIRWTRERWELGYGLQVQSEVGSIDTAFVSLPITLFVPGVKDAMDQGLTKFCLHNFRLSYRVYSTLILGIVISNITNQEYMVRPGDLAGPRQLRFQIRYTFK